MHELLVAAVAALGVAAPSGVEGHLRQLDAIARANHGNRAAGTAGYRASAAYVSARLRAAGWQVERRPVSFTFSRVLGRPTVSSGGASLGRRELRMIDASPGGAASGPVRRIGLGCARRAGVRRGEVAVARRGTCTFRAKALAAQRAGAVALVVTMQPGRPPIGATLGGPGVRIPVVLATSAGAGRVLRDGRRARVVVRAISERRSAQSVLARWPGAAAGRFVLAGAHLDSVPEGPGINDNGSGVAALLDAAERLRGNRRVRFAFWAAEELGLYGSRRYVRRLTPAQRARHIAYINLDMVGSPHPRPRVYGSPSLQRLLRGRLGARGIRAGATDLGGSSDHAPFRRAGIPVGGLFTGAGRPADPCYHRACDTFRNVNLRMARAMTGAARAALSRLAARG